MAKKKVTRKSGSKKGASKKKASHMSLVGGKSSAAQSSAMPSADAKPRQEIDVGSLSTPELEKRVTAIYKREKKVEAKTAVYALAKSGAKIAKGALQEAEDALRQEIDEQRWGPGPLFSADGQDKA